jgi:hypothetical protein
MSFNELIKKFADKQTYERIQGLLHAGLEDVHSHAVLIVALQSKNKAEGLVRLAFPKLMELAEEIENEENREKAATRPEHRDAPSKVNGPIPQGMWGVRYPYSQKHRSGLPSESPSPAAKALYTAFRADGSNRGEESAGPQSQNG